MPEGEARSMGERAFITLSSFMAGMGGSMHWSMRGGYMHRKHAERKKIERRTKKTPPTTKQKPHTHTKIKNPGHQSQAVLHPKPCQKDQPQGSLIAGTRGRKHQANCPLAIVPCVPFFHLYIYGFPTKAQDPPPSSPPRCKQ